MKILIIKLGALGDIIDATSVIKQILLHHARDDVHLLTAPEFADLFSNFGPLIVATFKRKGLLSVFKPLRWIRKQRFNRIYDLQSNDRTTIFCALSGSPFRVGNHPRYPYHAHPATTYIGECHPFERLNQIITSAKIKPAKPQPFLPATDNIITEVSKWRAQQNLLDGDYALLHAGSSAMHLNKRWPYFAELAINLSEPMKIVWVGGGDDVALNASLSQQVGINATHVFSVFGLVELGKKARFAITNDSAPMHILSCSHIPVFGLFGPTNPRRSHALGQLHNVIVPNNHIAQNDHDFKPVDISKITVQTVLNRLNDQMLI